MPRDIEIRAGCKKRQGVIYAAVDASVNSPNEKLGRVLKASVSNGSFTKFVI